jgi:hypothetical protein
MSLINITFFIQAFNFFIAFVLIKYLLFRPALLQIKAEDLFQETLINSVQESQSALAQKEQVLRNQMQALRSYFATHAPSIRMGVLFAEKKPGITFPDFDPRMLDEYRATLAAKLVKAVDHVR